ncbi:MAG: glycosyltransferase family 4 protein [Syntrophobacteraceae bacterium]
MRIGLITGTFLPVLGGVQWMVHYLATEYCKRGHEAVVFCQKLPGNLDGPLPVKPDYTLVKVGPKPIRGMQRSGLLCWNFSRQVLTHHAQKPFDLLHCHNVGVPTQIGARVKACAAIPVVATTCGDDIMTIPSLKYGIRLIPYYEAMVRDNLSKIDVVASISSATRRELESLGPAARIVDIQGGVDWENFQTATPCWLQKRLGLGEEKIIVVSLGRLHPVKDYPTGLRAFALAARRIPDLHYVIAGTGTKGLQKLVNELAIKERVHLLESVPMSDVPNLLHSADLFFLSSLSEGFAQVIIQALSCGLPCVVSDCSGNEDLAGHPGVVTAKAGDATSMGEALTLLASDKALRLKMGKQAHDCSSRYSWSALCEHYISIFKQLAPTAAF